MDILEGKRPSCLFVGQDRSKKGEGLCGCLRLTSPAWAAAACRVLTERRQIWHAGPNVTSKCRPLVSQPALWGRWQVGGWVSGDGQLRLVGLHIS